MCCIRCNKSHIIFLFFYIIRIKKNEQDSFESNTHILNSQLYKKLEENRDVENNLIRWTNIIDCFKMNYMYTNSARYAYSLCVVINPENIRNNTIMCQPNTEITYALLFDSLCSHDENNVLRNVKKLSNEVYKDKHPQVFEKKTSCTIFTMLK